MMAYTLENGSISAASASSVYSGQHAAINAFNTGTALTGASGNNAWATAANTTSGWIRCQFSSAKVITKVVYSNFYDIASGSQLAGANGFQLYGSNDGSNWTAIVSSVGNFAVHVDADVAHLGEFTVNNGTAYIFYKFQIYNNHGHWATMGLRRLQLYSGAPDTPAQTKPTVTTDAITGISASGATGGGNVTSAGTGTVSARGVCWNTSGTPTTANSKTTDGSGTGVYTSTLSGLTAPTTYYVRAYATSQYGTSYGAETSFVTIAPPTVTTTDPASKIKGTTALVRGEVISTGGADITERGICYSTSTGPDTGDNKVAESGTFGIGGFSASLTSLTRNTTYYARAYAINPEGTSYGSEISFRTLSVDTAAEPIPRLTDTKYLDRSGRYADPQNTNDVLPLVYGDLTDGAKGLWTLPCIDIVYSVYCYSGFPVLSVASGNSISIYKNDVLLESDDYIFDEDDDYEGEGAIATVTLVTGLSSIIQTAGTGLNDITASGTYTGSVKAQYVVKITTQANPDKFDWSADGGVTWKKTAVIITGSAQELENGIEITFAAVTGHTLSDVFSFTARPYPDNATITARGMGKVITGTTLMDNITDIVVDFLTIQSNFSPDLFEDTAFARAKNIFNVQDYAAAGVVDQDGVYWDIIIQMMSSFLGSAYLNGAGKLVLEIDNGTMNLFGAPIIRKSEIIINNATQRLENIINQCPAHFGYNFADGEFKHETNTIARVDGISQGIHGIREPNTPLQLYWCRDIDAAKEMQTIVVDKLKDPIYEVEAEVINLKNIDLDIGDFFVMSADRLYGKDGLALNNNYWRLVSIKPDYSRAKIGFRALQTPYYLTTAQLLDGSWDFDGTYLCGGNRDMTVY